jgi:hypothetical protein
MDTDNIFLTRKEFIYRGHEVRTKVHRDDTANSTVQL